MRETLTLDLFLDREAGPAGLADNGRGCTWGTNDVCRDSRLGREWGTPHLRPEVGV